MNSTYNPSVEQNLDLREKGQLGPVEHAVAGELAEHLVKFKIIAQKVLARGLNVGVPGMAGVSAWTSSRSRIS